MVVAATVMTVTTPTRVESGALWVASPALGLQVQKNVKYPSTYPGACPVGGMPTTNDSRVAWNAAYQLMGCTKPTLGSVSSCDAGNPMFYVNVTNCNVANPGAVGYKATGVCHESNDLNNLGFFNATQTCMTLNPSVAAYFYTFVNDTTCNPANLDNTRAVVNGECWTTSNFFLSPGSRFPTPLFIKVSWTASPNSAKAEFFFNDSTCSGPRYTGVFLNMSGSSPAAQQCVSGWRPGTLPNFPKNATDSLAKRSYFLQPLTWPLPLTTTAPTAPTAPTVPTPTTVGPTSAPTNGQPGLAPAHVSVVSLVVAAAVVTGGFL